MSRNTPPRLELGDVGSQLFQLNHEQLMLVPHETAKWRCCAKDCQGYARVHHFGVFPVVRYRKEWVDLTRNYLYCSKHWKTYKRFHALQPDTPLFNYKDPAEIDAEVASMFTLKSDNVKHNTVTIPVPPEELDRFKRWTDHYNMAVQEKKADAPYVEVIYHDPLNLYWLGGNFLSGNDRPPADTKKTKEILEAWKQGAQIDQDGNSVITPSYLHARKESSTPEKK